MIIVNFSEISCVLCHKAILAIERMISGMEIADNENSRSLNQKIDIAVEEAVEYLKSHVTLEEYDSSTHRTLVVSGWNDNENTLRSIGHYLVGLRASALDVALNICSVLFDDTPEGKLDILNSVYELVGENENSLTDIKIRDERNPWLAEAIWHLCMFIAKERTELHPNGNIIAIGPVHVKAKDHGLDGLVIYESEEQIGISLIESKAYKDDPNRAIRKALKFFQEIDGEEHTTRIRQDVSNIRSVLPREKQRYIVGTFWRQIRTYIPNPHYDSSVEIDWSKNRDAFTSLELTKDNIIIMPNIVNDFERFFNEVSEEMRKFVRGL